MTGRVLFVCLGNICRSPAAEGVARTMATAEGQGVQFDSAGTSDWHVGEAPYGPMQTAARARGYDLAALRARQFVGEDFDRFDQIVAMDGKNLQDIERMRPPGSATPVTLFTDFAPQMNMDHVPDPYYTRDFDGVLDLVEACAEGLLKSLS